MAFSELRNTQQFRDVLRAQADAALAAGEITARERRQVAVFCLLRPRKTQEVMEFVRARAVESGKPMAALEEIDWQAIVDFIKQILPMIIEFIQALLVIFA